MRHVRNLDPGSSPLAFYGSELRRLREAAGLNQRQLGGIIFCTGSLIGQIETAAKPPTREFTARADAALGADGALLRLWPLVSRSGLPSWFQQYAEMEATATTLYTFQAQLVHGLLQTEGYARAVLGAIREESLDERVAARLERQRVLEREEPPLFWMVLDEAALHRPVGGREVMREQLAHLLTFRERKWINVQVLPFDAGAHAGLLGSFNVLRFDKTADVAYTPGYGSGEVSIDPAEVRARSLRYALLQAAALSVEDSAELITCVMEDRYGDRP